MRNYGGTESTEKHEKLRVSVSPWFNQSPIGPLRKPFSSLTAPSASR
jgi:hypothetical protein